VSPMGPITVATRCKIYIICRSDAEIMILNPLSVDILRRADVSSEFHRTPVEKIYKHK